MKRLFVLAAALLSGAAAIAQNPYFGQKRSLFEVLPVTSKDIVFLGNSITDGGEWAELFDNRHVKNRGISADRASWLLDRLDPIVKGHPRKLFLMIGTNDLAAGATPAEVEANVRKLVERFRTESPWTRIYIQSILPVNGRSFDHYRDHYAQAEAIRKTNGLLEALCDGKQVVWLDLYKELADSNGDLNAAYTNDGLHLMGEGYLVWRDAIKPYVK